MKLNKKIPKALGVLSLILTTLLTSSTNFTTVYAASSQSSQTCIQMMKDETPKMTSNAKPSNEFKVTLNGKAVTLNSPILVDNGSTLLPVRAIGELLGIDIGYDNTNKVAIASNENTTLEIPLGYSFGVNNGSKAPITGARSAIYNSSTYLPLRYMSEQLKISIDYIASAKTIAISTNGPVVTPTPTAPATTGNTPQAVFNRAGSIKDIDASYFKKFTSIEQVKQLAPSGSDVGDTYTYKNMNYINVTMDMTKQYGNLTFDGEYMTIFQNKITFSASNPLIVFKDGTTTNFCKIFPSGKTLKDIKYMTYSIDDTHIFITPGTIDLSNLEFQKP